MPPSQDRMRTGEKPDIHADMSIVLKHSHLIRIAKYPARYLDTIAPEQSESTLKVLNVALVSSIKPPNLLDRIPFIILK